MTALTGLAVAVLAAAAHAGGNEAGGPPPSALVVLDANGSGALSMVGNSTVQIPARAVYVNSSSTTAVSTTGSALLDAPYLYVVGGAKFNGQSRCTGEVIRSVAPYENPYAGTLFPSTAEMTDHGRRDISSGQTVTLSPGRYSGGMWIGGNATVVMEPGIYVIGGDGLRINSARVSGEGVCLVIESGQVDFAGGGKVHLTPPTSGPLAGIVLAQMPSNTNEMRLAGGSELNVEGTIYVPTATLTLVGNSEVVGSGPQMGDVVVAHRVSLRGTGSIRIGRPGSPPLRLPPLPVYD